MTLKGWWVIKHKQTNKQTNILSKLIYFMTFTSHQNVFAYLLTLVVQKLEYKIRGYWV